MTYNIPPTIEQSVQPLAARYGIPDAIWEDIAMVESGFNTSAIGDHGTSFGLFQLHMGGQLPAEFNNNPSAVFDPALNAAIAFPSISKAYNNLQPTFNPSSLTWWEQFASQSGHPGGSPGQVATDNEAQKLMTTYTSNLSNNLGANTAGTCDLPCVVIGGKCINAIDPALPCAVQSQVVGDTVNSVTGSVSSITGVLTDKNTWIRAALVVGGIILAITGIYGLMGGTPQKAAGSIKKAAMVAAV